MTRTSYNTLLSRWKHRLQHRLYLKANLMSKSSCAVATLRCGDPHFPRQKGSGSHVREDITTQKKINLQVALAGASRFPGICSVLAGQSASAREALQNKVVGLSRYDSV